MDNQVTPTVEKTPEDIEREMEHTRGALTEKVVALEHQVVGTVQTAANTVTDTVEAVKSLVSEAPAMVSESVKQATAAVRENLDIGAQVQKHPWSAVGVSAGLGFLVGLLVFPGRSQSGQDKPAPQPFVPPPTAAPAAPGVLDELMGVIGQKARRLVETTVDTVAESLQATIREEAPKVVHDTANRLINSDAAECNAVRPNTRVPA